MLSDIFFAHKKLSMYTHRWVLIEGHAGFVLNGSTVETNANLNTTNLVTRPGVLRSGITYTISLIGILFLLSSLPSSLTHNTHYYTVTDAFGLTGKATTSFITNIPPKGGSFTVSPEEGDALSTQFTLSLASWQDVDNRKITYDMFYSVS